MSNDAILLAARMLAEQEKKIYELKMKYHKLRLAAHEVLLAETCDETMYARRQLESILEEEKHAQDNRVR